MGDDRPSLRKDAADHTPGRWPLAVVPRVISVAEPCVDYDAAGTPRMSARSVPKTVSATFTPVDFARYLERWLAAYLPAVPPVARAKPPMRATTAFGLMSLLAALAAFGVAKGGGSSDAGIAALVFFVVGTACLMQSAQWNMQRDNPIGYAETTAASWRGQAYRLLEQGHPGQAGWAWEQAAYAQQDAAAQRWDLAQAVHQAALREQERARFWEDLARRPIAEQWNAADGFLAAAAAEYARRSGPEIGPQNAPIPTYADAVAWLTANPSAW